MNLVTLTHAQWQHHSEKAHEIVFGKRKPASRDRVDFVMVAEESGSPMVYAVCRELDSESLYWQYGGAFPPAAKSPMPWEAMRLFLDGAEAMGYRRVSFLVENDNGPMLKLAAKAGFKIVGVRNFRGSVLLEHGLEFGQDDQALLPPGAPLQVGPLDKKRHFPLMVRWWEKRKFPPADISLTPKRGHMTHFRGQPIAGGFLFKSDANVAIIGNIVSDPESPRAIRSDAVDLLILSLADLAKDEGFAMVSCSTNLPRLMDRYVRLGFTKTDQNVSHFGRVL